MKWLDKTCSQYHKIQTKDVVQEEIEIYEENENEEVMTEEKEMQKHEPEEEKGPIESRTQSQVE